MNTHVLQPGDIVTTGGDEVFRVVEVKAGCLTVAHADDPDREGYEFHGPDDLIWRDDYAAVLFFTDEAAELAKTDPVQIAKAAEAEKQRLERVERRKAKRQAEVARARENNPILAAMVDGYGYREMPLSAGGDFIVPSRCLGIVFGLAETGKSMLMVDAGCCWSMNRPWLGLTDIVNGDTSGVLYLQCEGPREQVANRIKAWEQENGIDTKGHLFHSNLVDFDLADDDAADTIIEAANIEGCDVVIIDTLDAARPNGSNMVDGDVGAIFAKTLPKIVAECISVVLIAHSNESDRSLAGLSRQRNHAEWMIHVKERRGGNRVAILDKQKDVPGKPSVSFHIVDSGFIDPGYGKPVGVVRLGKRQEAAAKPPESPVAETVDDAVLAAVRDNPGASKRKIRELVPGRNAAIDAALQRLIDTGKVRVENAGQARRHVAV